MRNILKMNWFEKFGYFGIGIWKLFGICDLGFGI